MSQETQQFNAFLNNRKYVTNKNVLQIGNRIPKIQNNFTYTSGLHLSVNILLIQCSSRMHVKTRLLSPFATDRVLY